MNKIGLYEVKEIIKELILEAMFGKKIKIRVGDITYPALISRNVLYSHTKEKQYRITWFYPNSADPMGHVDFDFRELEYILKNKAFPPEMKGWHLNKGFESQPLLIFESQKSAAPIRHGGSDILVGTIDPIDSHIDSKYGGTHKTMRVRNNPKGDWRFNDETRIVYWHENHPEMYEKYVNIYIKQKLGIDVKQHLTLNNVKNFPEVYKRVWNDMHGVDSD